MLGIDVSENNGVIDWAAVKQNPTKVDFVYIKCTEGVGYTDKKCQDNSLRATAVAIRIGYYHFASLNNMDVVHDAEAEANYFCSVMKKMAPAQMLPVLDIEANKAGLTPAAVYNWIITFMRVMKQNGFPEVIIYSYTPFLNANLPATHDLGRNKLWIAAYNNLPAPQLPRGWSNFWLWQYTSTGTVKGFKGHVDCNKPPQESAQPRTGASTGASARI